MTFYILDTCIFNRIVEAVEDYTALPSALVGQTLYTTHVQWDELNNTPDISRRHALLSIFVQLSPSQIPTSGSVWGVSKWGMSKWGGGDGLIERMRPVLQALDKRSSRKKRLENQTRDILIAASAITNGLTLVTEDANLRTVVLQFGGQVIDCSQFADCGLPQTCIPSRRMSSLI